MIYFKRIFFSLMLLAFAGICFASCVDQKYMQPNPPGDPVVDAGVDSPKQPVVVVPSPTLDHTPKLVAEGNCEFTLPFFDTEWMPVTKEVPDGVKVWANPPKHMIVLFTKVKFDGTFEQFSVLNIKDLQESGGHLVAARVVVINGLQLLQLEGTGNNSKVFTLAGNARGVGYMLACSGAIEDDGVKETCQSIHNSFKIHFEAQ